MFLTPSDTPTAVIALELLDNLPHDKICCCLESGDLLQAEVVPASSIYSDPVVGRDFGLTFLDTSQPYIETFSPLNDPLLERILSIAPPVYQPTASRGPQWVPTVALGILMKLFECRPNSSVAFADFDLLPQPDAVLRSDGNLSLAEPAVGDPLVTDMEGNDHSCYLTSPPNALCDILFPTDFGRLAAFAKSAIKQSEKETKTNTIDVQAMKQSDFLVKYGSDEVDKTKGWTGYSPLTNDFGNCSVLTATVGAGCK